jgi:hypothetical protein
MPTMDTRRGGYDHAHQKLRLRVFAAQGGKCARPNCTNRATELHHKTPLSRGGARLDPRNAEGLCARHHREETDRLLADSDRTRRRPSPTAKPTNATTTVHEGAIRISVDGPRRVITPSGEVFDVPSGMTYYPRGDGGADVLPSSS